MNNLVTLRSNIHIDRHQIFQKFYEKLLKFMNSSRSFLMVVNGPSKCGKKYLLYQMLPGMHKPIEYLVVKNCSLKQIKMALAAESKHQLVVIENGLFESLNRTTIRSLFSLARKNCKKIILVLNKKHYIQVHTQFKYQKVVLFRIDYLSIDDIMLNFERHKFDFVSFKGQINLDRECLIENFYNLIKRPGCLRKILARRKQECVAGSFKDFWVEKHTPLYSLNSFLLSNGSYCVLMFTLEYESVETVIKRLHEQFNQIGLNQFMIDLYNERKLDQVKSKYFIIGVNKYDSELSPYIIQRVNSLDLRCIFLINDLSLFEKYKHLFKFKFKLNRVSKMDVIIESIGSSVNIAPSEYVRSEVKEMSMMLAEIDRYGIIEAKKSVLINRFNVIKFDLTKERSIFGSEKLSNLLLKYLIKSKKLILLIENLSTLENDDLELIKGFCEKRIKLLVHIKPDFRYKNFLGNFFGHQFLYLRDHGSELSAQLNTELISVLEKSDKFTRSNQTNVFLCYYFELKRIELISFTQYFDQETRIEPNDDLDQSIKGINGLVKSFETDKLEFENCVFESYFAALHIVKEVASDKEDNFNRVKNIILKYRYYKKYDKIWPFISQCLSSKNPYFNSLNLNQNKALISYWKLLLCPTNKDLIGVQHNFLLEQCIKNSNLENSFFKDVKLSVSITPLCTLDSNGFRNENFEQVLFESFNDAFNKIMDFLALNGHEKKPIYVRKFNKMIESLLEFSRQDSSEIVNFIEFLVQNELEHVLISSSLVEENFVSITQQLASVSDDRCEKLLVHFMQNNRFGTKFKAAKAMLQIRGQIMTKEIFDILIECYLKKFDLWQQVIDLIKQSKLSSEDQIETVFDLIKTSENVELVEALFRLLSNSKELKKSILDYGFDFTKLNSELHGLYFDLFFSLNSHAYLSELIDFVLSQNSNLIYRLPKYMHKKDARNRLLTNLSAIYNHENLVDKLEFLIDCGVLNIHDLGTDLYPFMKINEIFNLVNMLIRQNDIDRHIPDLTKYFMNLINSADESNKIDSLITYVIPSLWLIIREKLNHNKLIIELLQIIIMKFIKNELVFKSINNLIIQMVKVVERSNGLSMDSYFDLVQFYYNEFQHNQKCIIKKKNLEKFNFYSQEIGNLLSLIFVSMDSEALFEYFFRKYRELKNVDLVRFMIKKCIVSRLSVLNEESSLLIIDHDVIGRDTLEDAKNFLAEFNKLVVEETKHKSKLIILNDQSLHRIRI